MQTLPKPLTNLTQSTQRRTSLNGQPTPQLPWHALMNSLSGTESMPMRVRSCVASDQNKYLRYSQGVTSGPVYITQMQWSCSASKQSSQMDYGTAHICWARSKIAPR